MARRQEQSNGPAAMRAATGRTQSEWRLVLDEAGAAAWSHPQTVQWLLTEHALPAWWAQGITVDYEQTRKGREPGQRADGTFATQKSRTLPGDRLALLARAADALAVEYGEPHGQSLDAALPNVRWRLPDGTRLSVAVGPQRATGAAVTVTQERIPDAETAATARRRFADVLAAL
ncbi:DUF4287 domain-containing protein [Microbacterium gorillae]|uniref:DUF4287 domain-containing protein n=1 Tax=Microbacterium gorillae TaxID=1231063 RepID=UPI0006940354|nr:DUF4287 domain-containing protein [Microbacterium gorillae]